MFSSDKVYSTYWDLIKISKHFYDQFIYQNPKNCVDMCLNLYIDSFYFTHALTYFIIRPFAFFSLCLDFHQRLRKICCNFVHMLLGSGQLAHSTADFSEFFFF